MPDKEKTIKGLEYLYGLMSSTSTEVTQPIVNIVLDALVLLKKEKNFKPKEKVETYICWTVCGYCGNPLMRQWKWCPHCGRGINWNETN